MDAKKEYLFEFEKEDINVGFLTLQNAFITHFMPDAPGNYVKVYLAGLMRCYGAKIDQWASYKTIADEQHVSLATVRRAWQYWEQKGLVRIIPRFLRDPNNPMDYKTERTEEYRIQASNIIRFKRNILALIKSEHQDSPVTSDISERIYPPITSDTPEQIDPPITGDRPPLSPVIPEEIQIEERQDKTVGSGQVSSYKDQASRNENSQTGKQPLTKVTNRLEVALNRTISDSEQKHLSRLVAEYGVEDVECAITEYGLQSDIQKIKHPLRYIEGVLKNWAREGKRMTDVYEHLEKIKKLNKGGE